MLKRARQYSLCILIVCFAVATVKVLYLSTPLSTKAMNAPKAKPLTQNRIQTQKDFFFSTEGERRHTQIVCPSSELTLMPKGKRVELLESMHDLTCLMQEGSNLRVFTADEGVYSYLTSTFNSEAVTLSLSQLEGSDLPPLSALPSPFMKGLAKNVSLIFGDKNTEFHAKQFRAEISGGEE